MHKLMSMTDKYNLDITITLDSVSEEYDYRLVLLDAQQRLLGVGKPNAEGGKSITIPSWGMKEDGYTLKVQATDGMDVVSEESYHLSFRENTWQMELQRLQGPMRFDCVVRKKLWEKQGKKDNTYTTLYKRNRYEEKYLEQMDAIYCDSKEFFA